MATFFGSPPFLSLPITRIHHLSSSSQTPAPVPAPPQCQPQPQPPSSSSLLRIVSSEQQQSPVTVKVQQQKDSKFATMMTATTTTVESTDWKASTLTRRFGLSAGLAWATFLAVGVLSQQIKTSLEVTQQEAKTRDVKKEKEVVLPNGIRYFEMRVGSGASPRPGDLVMVDLKGRVEGNGEVFVDTFSGDKKPVALVMQSRPYSKGMCEGIECALRSMKEGGKRRVRIPPRFGFGEKGADLGSGLQIPPFATVEYIIEVDEVSTLLA